MPCDPRAQTIPAAELTVAAPASRGQFRRSKPWSWLAPTLAIVGAGLAWSGNGRAQAPVLHAAGLAAAAAQETDTDGDGMPDAWETFFGLNPNNPGDGATDSDGDGLTNAQEYAARRHPVGRYARFFAEGSTGFFDTSVAVVNLSATDTAHVALALLDDAGGVRSHQVSLGPRQRQTVSVNAVLGVSSAVSIIVESDQPIAADRSMAWGTTGIGSSLDSGSSAPATTWYFAEGATGAFFLYYLFENPGVTAATVTVRYLREGATPLEKIHTLPPHSRTTVFVNGEDPGLAVSSLGVVVTSNVPILAERAMYLDAGNTFGGGSASSGSDRLATQWYFGEGATGPFFHAFLSLLNPGALAATATVTYHLSDGTSVAKAYTVLAESRRTVYFNGEAASDPALAGLATGAVWFSVQSSQPIMAERAMWWSTWPWYEGHAAPGNTTADVSWAVPDGRHDGATNEQTYVLIGNTTTTPGQVRLTLIPETGAASALDVPIAASERLSINVGSLFGLSDARFSVLIDSLGSPGVPLVVDYARYRTPGSLPFSGGGAARGVPPTVADAAPAVTTTTPSNGATGVARNAAITINFNESVNASTSSFTLECPTGGPQAYTLSASPASTFTLTPTSLLPAGVFCTVTVVGAQITDVDSNDPPNNMVANTVVTFAVPPDAGTDVYPQTVIGNVPISSANVPYSVATNDVSLLPVTVTAFDATTVQGGTVAMVTSGPAMGQFTYNPPAGYEGLDSFTYTVGNAAGSDAALVTLSVSGMIWFVNENAVVAGDGRLGSPFDSLQAFVAVNDGVGNHPNDSDGVFLYESATSYTVSTAPFALRQGQRLIGQDHSSSLASLTGVTVPSGSAALPAMNPVGTATTIASTVRLATDAQVHGLSIATTAATGIDDPAAAITGVVLSEVAVASTNATCVALSNVAGTLSFRSISATNAAPGISLAGTTGSFTVTGAGTPASGGTILNATGEGITLNGAQNVSLGYMDITDPAASGISGTGVANLTLSQARITGAGDAIGEYGLSFATPGVNNLIGVVTISDTTITGMHQHGVAILNVGGALAVTVRDTTIGVNNPTDGGDGILLRASGTLGTSASMALTVGETVASGCVFQSVNGVSIRALSEAPNGASSVNVDVNGCTFNGASANNGGVAITANTFATNTAIFDIRNNTMAALNLAGITALALDGTLVQGTIDNNVLTMDGTEGVAIEANGGAGLAASTLRAAVRNNSVSGSGGEPGISLRSRTGNFGRLDAQLEGNTVAPPGVPNADGISIRAENVMSLCLDVRDVAPFAVNNNSQGSGVGVGYRLDNVGTGALLLQGWSSGLVDAFFAGQSNVGTVATSGTLTMNGVCTVP